LVTALGGPAIVVKVFPSGWAYLIASEPEEEPTVLVLTPKGLRKALRAETDAKATVATAACLERSVRRPIIDDPTQGAPR
jgi:hypothetical protein